MCNSPTFDPQAASWTFNHCRAADACRRCSLDATTTMSDANGRWQRQGWQWQGGSGGQRRGRSRKSSELWGAKGGKLASSKPSEGFAGEGRTEAGSSAAGAAQLQIKNIPRFSPRDIHFRLSLFASEIAFSRCECREGVAVQEWMHYVHARVRCIHGIPPHGPFRTGMDPAGCLPTRAIVGTAVMRLIAPASRCVGWFDL